MPSCLSITTKTAVPYSGFLQMYRNEKTRENYRTALRKFLKFVTPEETEINYDLMAKTYLDELKEGRNPAEDLMGFATRIAPSLAPTTFRLTINVIAVWIEDNGFAIGTLTKKRILRTVPHIRSIRRETELTRNLFTRLYRQMTKEWARTLLLVQLSTGMRLGEALSLQTTDIIRTETVTEIHIRAETTKTKTERIVYLTKEATYALDTYLASEPAGTAVFPYTKAAAERQMRTAADKAGYGKTGSEPRPVHWHMTRKWFISRFSLYANKEVAEELAGHEGYLSRSYRRFTRRQMLAQFRKAENHLELFPDRTKTK